MHTDYRRPKRTYATAFSATRAGRGLICGGAYPPWWHAGGKSAMQMRLGQIEAKLRRARRILNERPGTAHALILKALSDLDELTVAHLGAARSS